MVLINDKKFACQTCIKGHRSSSCAHSDRPLFEIKKKGRPVTQCSHCRELRKTKQVHVKCLCEAAPEELIAEGTAGPAASRGKKKEKEQPVPTYPNGLRDFQDMRTAAEALNGLQGGDVPRRDEKTRLDALLNPCMCRVGGMCNCCHDKPSKKESHDSPSPAAGGCCSTKKAVALASQSQLPSPTEHHPTQQSSSAIHSSVNSTNNSAESLIDAFNSKAQVQTSLPASLRNFTPAEHHDPIVAHPAINRTRSHPAHTSPHIHKTKLFSPYGGSQHTSQSGYLFQPKISSLRQEEDLQGFEPPAPGIDEETSRFFSQYMANLISNQSGPSSTNDQPPQGLTFYSNPDESNTLSPMYLSPGGTSPVDGTNGFTDFLSAENLPSINSFITNEDGDVMMSGCTCGDGCACPGCAIHGIPGDASDGGGGHGDEDGGCGQGSCGSCLDCTHLFTVEQILAASAANLPPAPPSRKKYSLLAEAAEDVKVLPPSVLQDSAGSLLKSRAGLVEIPRLVCCSGQCKCEPGSCTCGTDCCGCCGSCDCASSAVGTPRASSVLSGLTASSRVGSYSPADSQPNVASASSNNLQHNQFTHASFSNPNNASGSCCGSSSEGILVQPVPVKVEQIREPSESSCCSRARNRSESVSGNEIPAARVSSTSPLVRSKSTSSKTSTLGRKTSVSKTAKSRATPISVSRSNSISSTHSSRAALGPSATPSNSQDLNLPASFTLPDPAIPDNTTPALSSACSSFNSNDINSGNVPSHNTVNNSVVNNANFNLFPAAPSYPENSNYKLTDGSNPHRYGGQLFNTLSLDNNTSSNLVALPNGISLTPEQLNEAITMYLAAKQQQTSSQVHSQSELPPAPAPAALSPGPALFDDVSSPIDSGGGLSQKEQEELAEWLNNPDFLNSFAVGSVGMVVDPEMDFSNLPVSSSAMASSYQPSLNLDHILAFDEFSNSNNNNNSSNVFGNEVSSKGYAHPPSSTSMASLSNHYHNRAATHFDDSWISFDQNMTTTTGELDISSWMADTTNGFSPTDLQ